MWNLKERAYNRLPVPLQNAAVSRYGRRIFAERFGPEFDRLSAFLADSERLDRDRLRAYQEERLRALVDHAYRTVPYHREVMDARRLTPRDIRTLDDLPKLPLLTREDVAANGARLVSTAVDRRRIRKATTGGTTGSPLAVWWDGPVAAMNHACTFRVRRWAGFQLGRPYATIMGRPVVPVRQTGPPFWRENRSWNQFLFSSLHLKEENIPHYLRKLRAADVEALEAYPSAAYVLARFLEAEGERLPLKAVFLSGEPLLPFERAVIEDRFQVGVFDAYSQAERVVFTSECELHQGHHVFQEFGICELVDGDGAPVEAGMPGQIAGTSLHNFAMPLIRYVFGDVATSSDRTCACGRGLAMLEGFATREEDILVTPDGRMIPPLLVVRGFQAIRGVRRSQIVQHDPAEVTVKVVLDEPLRPEDETEFRTYLAQRLGPEMKVSIERVEELPLTARGKFRRVVSTVPLRWGGTTTPNLHAPS
jgi:phenylacetate-CoA ligase